MQQILDLVPRTTRNWTLCLIFAIPVLGRCGQEYQSHPSWICRKQISPRETLYTPMYPCMQVKSPGACSLRTGLCWPLRMLDPVHVAISHRVGLIISVSFVFLKGGLTCSYQDLESPMPLACVRLGAGSPASCQTSCVTSYSFGKGDLTG